MKRSRLAHSASRAGLRARGGASAPGGPALHGSAMTSRRLRAPAEPPTVAGAAPDLSGHRLTHRTSRCTRLRTRRGGHPTAQRRHLRDAAGGCQSRGEAVAPAVHAAATCRGGGAALTGPDFSPAPGCGRGSDGIGGAVARHPWRAPFGRTACDRIRSRRIRERGQGARRTGKYACAPPAYTRGGRL